MMQQDDDLKKVTLDYIVEDLLSFFNELPCLNKAKEMIENKCGIKNEPEHKCWPEDKIKQAWEETIKEDKQSSRRKDWAYVIMLQVVKSLDCDLRKQTTPNSVNRSSQSSEKQERVGAAGGDEQMSREGKKVSEESSFSEDSGVASGSQLSRDEDSSPAELNLIANSSNSKTKNAALMNEDEDTLVNNYDQQKDFDDYELYVEGWYWLDGKTETHEDGSTDDKKKACGKEESIKGNLEDRSSQGNDELKTETAAVSVAPSYDEKNMEIVDEYNYICIPLSMFHSKSTTESPYENADPNADTNSDNTYKLIDWFPSGTRYMYGKKSYVMSYDTDKKNAQWVYEILNKSTVPYCYKKVAFKKDDKIDDDKQALNSTKGFKDTDYVRGHLAAVANHIWCQEAYNDTYLISNMTPQINSINNGIWKTLECYCRTIIYKDDKDEVRNVHVYTGPLYLNNEGSIMKGKAVPTHYFKVVIVENVNGKSKVECYLVENKKKESETTDNISTDNQGKKKKKREKIYLKDYISDINKIEEISGLTFRHKSVSNKETVKKTLTCTGENERKHATIEVHVSKRLSV